ncbi:MAG TPA: hypothetical protein VKF41_06550 [Bryobacteraceae bacterium]|nr:hypothetical protein [Bryobacteraceae bacterium]
MAGYLDQYGAGDARRERIIRTLVISVLAIAVVAGAAIFIFHNYREERQVKRFFELLAAHDYKDAHAMFDPGPAYPMSSFLRDWGPEAVDVSGFRIVKSRSCYSNTIITVRYGKDQEQVLWVDRDSLSLSFAPYDACPPNGHPPVSAPGVQ